MFNQKGHSTFFKSIGELGRLFNLCHSIEMWIPGCVCVITKEKKRPETMNLRENKGEGTWK